jgi:hypothetical protein
MRSPFPTSRRAAKLRSEHNEVAIWIERLGMLRQADRFQDRNRKAASKPGETHAPLA